MLSKGAVTSSKKVGDFTSYHHKPKNRRQKMGKNKFLRMLDGTVVTSANDTDGCQGCYFLGSSGKCVVKDDEEKRKTLLTHLPSCATDSVIYKATNATDLSASDEVIDSATGKPHTVVPRVDDYVVFEVDLPSGNIQAIGLVAQGNDELIVLSFVPGGDSRIFQLDAVHILQIIQKK